MKTAFGYDGWAQSCGEEVCKTLVAGKGYGDRCDSIPKVLVRAFNFELFASPPPETVDALCACRAGDWMLVQRSQGFRAGSFGQFVADGAAETLDCGHSTSCGNGTPCLVLCYDGYNQSTSRETSMTLRSAMGGTERNDADPKVLCPPPTQLSGSRFQRFKVCGFARTWRPIRRVPDASARQASRRMRLRQAYNFELFDMGADEVCGSLTRCQTQAFVVIEEDVQNG